MPKPSEAWLRLIQTVAVVEAELGKSLQSRHGLGLTDFRALDSLAKAPNRELRMQDLATALQLNQSSVSRLVERLAKAGLGLRDLCPDDKRGVYCVLTDEGQKRRDEALPTYESVLKAEIEKQGATALLLAHQDRAEA